MSYKMLSHLKVHSFLFDIENIVTTINLLKHIEQASWERDSPRRTQRFQKKKMLKEEEGPKDDLTITRDRDIVTQSKQKGMGTHTNHSILQ